MLFISLKYFQSQDADKSLYPKISRLNPSAIGSDGVAQAVDV